MRALHSTLCTVILFAACAARADDWPQWLGPQRDEVWRESGIVDRFPESGLEVRWRSPIGLGYSGPAVAGGRVFVMDYQVASGEVTNNPGGPDKLDGEERVLCYDAQTGKPVWQHAYARPYRYSFAGGPRCTPTVDGNRVYALGAEGNLTCLDAANGKVLWSKDFAKDYQAKTPMWGVSSHPLVDGESLFCVVGGPGSEVVAFDKRTGRELWRNLTASEPGYCPPMMIEHAGVKQLLIWHPERVCSLDPQSGKEYWSAEVQPRYGMSIIAPRKLGSQLFISGFGVAATLKLDDHKPGAEVMWRGNEKNGIYTSCCTPLLRDGIVYGCDIETGALIAARLDDGKRLWETFVPTHGLERRARYGTAFIVPNGDRAFLFTERGDLILAKLTPERYEEISRFHVLEPTEKIFGRMLVWSHPAFAQRCLFARNDKELVCVSLAAKGK